MEMAIKHETEQAAEAARRKSAKRLIIAGALLFLLVVLGRLALAESEQNRTVILASAGFFGGLGTLLAYVLHITRRGKP